MRASRTQNPVPERLPTKGVPKKIGDAIGLLHFIFANLLVAIGELTPWFNQFGWQLPGLRVVYVYVDAPMVSFFQSWTQVSTDWLKMLLIGELVIVASSILYGLIAYLFVTFLFSVIDF